MSEEKFKQYIDFYLKTCTKHHDRSKMFLDELKKERDEILNDS